MPNQASIWPNSHAMRLSGIPSEIRRRRAMPLCQKRMSRICTSAYSHVMIPTTRSLSMKAPGWGELAPTECHTHTTRPTNSVTPSRMARTRTCTVLVSHGYRGAFVARSRSVDCCWTMCLGRRWQCRARSSRALVNRLSSNIGCQHVRAEDVAVRHGHDVPIQHHEVGELARRERAHHRLLEGGKGRPEGHRLERFVASHPLLRHPAACWPVIGVLAR